MAFGDAHGAAQPSSPRTLVPTATELTVSSQSEKRTRRIDLRHFDPRKAVAAWP